MLVLAYKATDTVAKINADLTNCW